MKKIILATAMIGGLLGLVVSLTRTLNPAPLPAQIYPQGTSEMPTLTPVVIHISYDDLVAQVVPPGGQTIAVMWGDMGQKLVEAGAIDLDKFKQQYGGLTPEQQEILQGDSLKQVTFTPDNIQFWTNMLWSFGLTQHSRVLSEGPMATQADQFPLGNYASTGGWTLGSLDATELYNSANLITLTPEQETLVYQVASNVFRPCCNNPTSFPDCNHGMAVLGLLELMASQGMGESDLYHGALLFNSYAFPDTYITLAAYFAMQNIPWTEVDPRTALGSEYSSAQGAQQVVARIGSIPGTPQGGSCGT